ncbi:hypothetical protein O1611_g7663 [Lasiodiplodia mahajangana]|uniref:Uncharacterized protein n=1 Tax=Lasiodiplodia mahajangana TaxID=1108764 RepID=A0ACC2JET2_9PEZI|nr:hypothetical protein O1611_g7663 [Lasiodiplodia mahajangana]
MRSRALGELGVRISPKRPQLGKPINYQRQRDAYVVDKPGGSTNAGMSPVELLIRFALYPRGNPDSPGRTTFKLTGTSVLKPDVKCQVCLLSTAICDQFYPNRGAKKMVVNLENDPRDPVKLSWDGWRNSTGSEGDPMAWSSENGLLNGPGVAVGVRAGLAWKTGTPVSCNIGEPTASLDRGASPKKACDAR